jgi:predicted RND superfamily exporter protein
MKIIELKEPQHINTNIKDLPASLIDFINGHVSELNGSSVNDAELIKAIKQKQTIILKQVEKDLKIVPQNYYRNLLMLFGMSGIGLPIGVTFGMMNENMGLLGIGLPIGMMIGLGIGLMMDKKAFKEGRQLNLEIKY